MTRLFGKNKGSYSAVENTPDHSIPANPKAMDGLVANEMENLIDLSNRINLCAEMLLRNTQKDNLVAIRETLAKALKVLATAAEFNNIANKMLGNLHDTRNQRKDIYLASLNELNTEIEAAAIKHSINIATQDINERSRIETQLKLSRMSRITFDTVTKKEFANRQVHELLESDIKNVLIPSYRKDREVRYNTPPDIENIKTHVASIQGLLKTTPDAPITRTTPSYLEESAREQSSADTLSRAGNIIFHPTVVHAAAAIVITAASTTPAAAVTLGAIIASTALKTREQKTLNDIRREYELLHEYSYLNQATVSLQNELARNHPLQMHQHFAMHKPFSYNDITEKRVSDQTKYLHKAAQQESGDATANTIDASANITIPTASIATHPEASELAHLTTEIAAAGSLAGVGIISIALSITQRRVINDMLHKVSLDMHELRNDVPYYSSHTELADMIKQKRLN